MSATNELRRLLDERGVEWDADDEIMDDGSISQVTYWYSNGIEWSADGRDEYLAFDAVQLITPEQAIAATLGDIDATVSRHGDAGTCRRLPADNYYETCIVRWHGYEREFGYWKCSKCGTNCFEGARYCMNCGAKVVSE